MCSFLTDIQNFDQGQREIHTWLSQLKKALFTSTPTRSLAHAKSAAKKAQLEAQAMGFSLHTTAGAELLSVAQQQRVAFVKDMVEASKVATGAVSETDSKVSRKRLPILTNLASRQPTLKAVGPPSMALTFRGRRVHAELSEETGGLLRTLQQLMHAVHCEAVEFIPMCKDSSMLQLQPSAVSQQHAQDY